jgi:glycerol-3-phosphate dehydrogenase
VLAASPHQWLADEGRGVYRVGAMERNLKQLAGRKYDVLVIGAGACGAFVAREAALRGLAVAVIDRRDFCGATSANSLKVIHGGLRYLQQADVGRVLESARARRHLMRIAPHLVLPLPCLLPTERRLMRSRLVMAAGMLANDLLGVFRNRGADAAHFVPRGRLLSAQELAAIIPGGEALRSTGGALWYDGLAYNSERLVLDAVASAVEHGAEAANYVEATGFLYSGNRVTGVAARDVIAGSAFEIQADLVINAAGPWAAELAASGGRALTAPPGLLAMGMNFVLRRQISKRHAFALQAASADGSARRMLFFVPWRDVTLAGTYYRAHQGPASALAVTGEDVDSFLGDLQRACPAAGIKREDVALIQAGLLPALSLGRPGGEPDLSHHAAFIDHEVRNGVPGLLSVMSVKYTTSWNAGRRAAQFAVRRLGRGREDAPAGVTPLPGGDIADLERFVAEQGGDRHLAYNYGTRRRDIVALGQKENLALPLAAGTEVLGAEVVYAVRCEMAQTLCDVAFRRTDLASAGLPSAEALAAAAGIMARECGWSAERTAQELARVRAVVFPGSEFGSAITV